ncbi:NAD(P)H-hydrate dehydratase [Pseudomonas sp. KNUC1026]|uniref:NAD(P)H-hydrate dehydratase n=1 Tax=Pseudomonas sp. KNUC1026 TaxID=2893890 RepID=UPI001F418EDA|nr:NAD(P)H-hydrate dehydratase [Pseudomonas sp. KNUC1026]UFH49132.1 NAD(P)H-hydrate dehydratase [Pseudomonas sp. KNUC1026]
MPTHCELPDLLYTAEQVRDLDARLIAAGTPGLELMQRAASAAWRALRRRWPVSRPVTVLAGHGNNAGDGYLIASLAQRAGWNVRLLIVGDPARLRGDAAQAYAMAQADGVPMHAWHADAVLEGVLVDALLGTGLKGDVREPYVDVIQAINDSELPVLAVDLPSGLCADTGRVLGVAVRANLTVTFIALKLGLFTGDGLACAGDLVFDDLQADTALVAAQPASAQRLAAGNLRRLAPRSPVAHKGQFGRVLAIGGDHGTGGASLMSAEMALRAGAGMVSLATRPEHVGPALVRLPEVMAAGVESANQLLALVKAASVLVVGPGMGQGAWGRGLLSVAASAGLPQVWDADALNLLASHGLAVPAGSVITPHPGEAARLLGISTAEVQADRPAAVQALAKRYACVVVLKGSGSLVAEPGGRLALCNHGHPAMATAGLGDVLAGLIGALMAQHMAPFHAASLGVWLHARAGQALGSTGRGLAATDLIPMIRQLLEEYAPCKK